LSQPASLKCPHTPTSVTFQLNSIHTEKPNDIASFSLFEMFILSPDPSVALHYVCQSLVITAWRIIRLQIDEMERSWQACWKPEWDAPWLWVGGMCGQLSSIKNVYWETYTNIMEIGEGVYITRREFTTAGVTSGATVYVNSLSWRFSRSRRIYIIFLAFNLCWMLVMLIYRAKRILPFKDDANVSLRRLRRFCF